MHELAWLPAEGSLERLGVNKLVRDFLTMNIQQTIIIMLHWIEDELTVRGDVIIIIDFNNNIACYYGNPKKNWVKWLSLIPHHAVLYNIEHTFVLSS